MLDDVVVVEVKQVMIQHFDVCQSNSIFAKNKQRQRAFIIIFASVASSKPVES
jgi:hypothetical protein